MIEIAIIRNRQGKSLPQVKLHLLKKLSSSQTCKLINEGYSEMTLEKRIRKLEKQVIVLKAKVKANDLWKLELQTWIYKKFKRLIIDQGPYSASSGESSESASDSDERDGDYIVRTPLPKRAEGSTPSSMLTRNGRKRRRNGNSLRHCNDDDLANPKTSVDASARFSSSMMYIADEPVPSTVVVKTELGNDSEVLANQDDSRTADISGDTFLGPGDDSCHSNSNSKENLVVQDTVDDEELLRDSAEASSSDNLTNIYTRRKVPFHNEKHGMEVRPDLQKYFCFSKDSNPEEGMKVVCLVKGCGSVLKIKPTSKWSNPVRHLAGVHRIPEYIEQAPSAVTPKVSSRM